MPENYRSMYAATASLLQSLLPYLPSFCCSIRRSKIRRLCCGDLSCERRIHSANIQCRPLARKGHTCHIINFDAPMGFSKKFPHGCHYGCVRYEVSALTRFPGFGIVHSSCHGFFMVLRSVKPAAAPFPGPPLFFQLVAKALKSTRASRAGLDLGKEVTGRHLEIYKLTPSPVYVPNFLGGGLNSC